MNNEKLKQLQELLIEFKQEKLTDEERKALVRLVLAVDLRSKEEDVDIFLKPRW